MEGFVLIQLHERIVAECAEVDGMYLAHPCADKTNLYIDKDGEGYWVTPKTLATLIGRHTPGMSIEGKHVIPWVPDNLFSSRLESLIHVLEHVPGILGYKRELHQLKLDVQRDLSILADYGVLKTTTDTDIIWHNVPTLNDTQFAIAGNTNQVQYAVIRHGDRIWELKVVN